MARTSVIFIGYTKIGNSDTGITNRYEIEWTIACSFFITPLAALINGVLVDFIYTRTVLIIELFLQGVITFTYACLLGFFYKITIFKKLHKLVNFFN
jgi:hypothetical protein